jgi:phosphoglycerate dehydrogenase-like enzyme
VIKLLIALQHRFELWNAPAWLATRMTKDFPQLSVVDIAGYQGLEHEIADAEILIGWSLRDSQFKAAKRLRWIHSPAAAVHQLLIPEIVAGDVMVTNAREVHGPVVAEHAMTLILAMAKRLPSAQRYQQRREWGQTALWQEFPKPRELAGSTLLLLGLGSIGREVAPRAHAFGMKVIAVRQHPEKGSAGVEQVVGPGELDEMLPLADFVVIAMPVTPATRETFNAARLARMKRDAYLINVGRGPLVDEGALLRALQARSIGGAALDVFAEEPLPQDSPLWELDNLLITPHTAAHTERLWERHYALISDNLRRYLSGQPLRNLVDKAKGY